MGMLAKWAKQLTASCPGQERAKLRDFILDEFNFAEVLSKLGYSVNGGHGLASVREGEGRYKKQTPAYVLEEDGRFNHRRTERKVRCDSCQQYFTGPNRGNFVHTTPLPKQVDRWQAWKDGTWDATWHCLNCIAYPGEPRHSTLERIFPGHSTRAAKKRVHREHMELQKSRKVVLRPRH